jgi:sortase (surface protein transpeptidase)
MATVAGLVRRLLPALLMASSVTLLTAGVFNWAPPLSLGEFASASPTPDPGDPIFSASPSPVSTSPAPSATSSASPTPTATPVPHAEATRILIPSLDIDLAVIAGDTTYPLCDVAQYLFGFAAPGQPGTTYLYGHARTGMFLPLLEESENKDGAGMIGALVKLYTADLKLHVYQIDIVKRHATDLTLAYEVEPGQHQLIMQTSEGPSGTIPKLQVAAKPIGVYQATADVALPTAQPTVCG